MLQGAIMWGGGAGAGEEGYSGQGAQEALVMGCIWMAAICVSQLGGAGLRGLPCKRKVRERG